MAARLAGALEADATVPARTSETVPPTANVTGPKVDHNVVLAFEPAGGPA